MSTRKSFVVGRRSRAGVVLIVIAPFRRPVPIRGPWTLRAVVSRN